MKVRTLTKTALPFMMSIVVLFTSLSGCSKSASQEADKAKLTSNDSNLVGNVYKTGLPIVKDKVTYKIIVMKNSAIKKAVKDIEEWNVLEKETNIALDIEEISDTAWAEKVPLLISSGSLPDFFTESISDITAKYYNTGLFLPLNDLIDNWAPNLKKIISDKAIYANLKSPDGKLYATPKGEMAPWSMVGNQLFLNKVWLDKLGLKMPETTDEFYNVLKAFKEKDPNGNGKADEIPLSLFYKQSNSINSQSKFINLFSGAFGLSFNDKFEGLENGKYVFAPTRQEFRDWLQYMNKLYAEGLMDKDLFTQDRPQIKAKGTGSDQLLGSVVGFWPDSYVAPEKVADFVAVKPLKGPTGKQEWPFLNTKMIPNANGVSISKNCKYPEAVIRWVDNILSSATKTAEYEYGPANLGGIEISSDGKYKITTDKPAKDANMTADQWSRNFALRDMLPVYYSPEGIANYRVIDDTTKRKVAYQDIYMPYMQKESITKAHFADLTDDEKSVVASKEVELSTLIESFIANSVIKGINDSTWNKFQDDLKKTGVDKLISLKQKALDSYYKSIK